MAKQINFELSDNREKEGIVSGTVTVDRDYVDIGVDGFKSAGGNDMISVELYEGKLMLRVWDSPKKEDTSYSIDLSEVLKAHRASE